MARLTVLSFFVCIFAMALFWDLKRYWRLQDDRGEKFLQGLEQFAAVAENHLANTPMPDLRNWRSQRIKTIHKLNELRHSLDNVCFYANCAKAAGSGMGITCALTSIAAAIMGLNGIPLPLSVMAVGGFTCPSAVITKEASSIIESIMSTNYMNYLQAALRKDREASRSLNEWLKFSPNLEAEVKSIFGFDLKSENSIIFIMVDEFYRLYAATKNYNEAIQLMKRGKYSKLLTQENEIRNLFMEIIKYFINYSLDTRKILPSLSLLNRLISVKEYIRSLSEENQNLIVDKMITMTSFLFNKLNINVPPAAKATGFILLNVLDLAKKVTSFKDSTKIIMDGKCPYSDGLKDITDMLKLELTMIESSFFT